MMLIGKRISGRYKILRAIGGGGMANVYLATDMILDRDVAIKILRLDFAREDEFIRRFQREAQSATSLAHENIVSIYDVGEEEDIYYIVMEYVDGMTLKQYIQYNHPIDLQSTVDIMRQLTSAVAHAHEHQIIHRDIKPQNILIDHHGRVKITDFGIAMALSATAITQTNAVLGSVHYLSPEQARGGMATKRSDIYSLGIVMFELLTGRLPFSGESAVSIALKHLQSETPSPRRWDPEIPQSVENIVLKATAKDPFIRYENAEEMERDIESSLNPDRLNEAKFAPPQDDEMTKAIPVISNSGQFLDGNTKQHIKEEQQSDKVDQPKKKKRKIWPWAVGIISALILMAIIFFMFVLPAIIKAQNVHVPDVSGEDYEKAVLMLMDAGLSVDDKVDSPSDEVPEGLVIRTNPRADKEVKKGSSVTIYLSTGKERFEFDQYVGMQIDDVVEMLENEGFTDITINEEHDADTTPGTIIEQKPNPNDAVIPEETSVVFVVSLGEEKVTLADLREYNRKGLESYEKATGIVVEIAGEEYSEDIPEGLVISQDPAPETALSKGEKVKVILSKGPEEIPPETVYRTILIPYEPEEEGMEQEIKIYIDDMNNKMTVPADTFHIDGPVEVELQFTIKPGQTAGYKIIRDNTVIEETEVHLNE